MLKNFSSMCTTNSIGVKSSLSRIILYIGGLATLGFDFVNISLSVLNFLPYFLLGMTMIALEALYNINLPNNKYFL